MVIQNSAFTGKSKITRLIALLVLISIVSIVSFFNTLLIEFKTDYIVSWYYKLIVILLIVILYAFYIWQRYQKKYFFLYFTDDDKQNLVFRFYHIKTFGKKYTTYKIPIHAFQKYEIIETAKTRELFLFQKVNDNKTAKYPPISIMGYNKEEISNLKEILQTYLPKI